MSKVENANVDSINTQVDSSNPNESWKYENRTNVIHRTADDVNANDFDNGYNPPYQSGTRVTEYTTKEEDVFVRVHNQGNPNRPWMMRAEAIEGLTAEQIQRKYSLPSKPTFISEVHVPAGTRIRTGKVESNFEQQGGGGEGATQYQMLLDGYVPIEYIQNTKVIN